MPWSSRERDQIRLLGKYSKDANCLACVLVTLHHHNFLSIQSVLMVTEYGLQRHVWPLDSDAAEQSPKISESRVDGCLSLNVVRKLFAEQQLSFLPTIMDVHPFLLHVICTSFRGLKLSTSNLLFKNILVRRSLSVKPSPIQRIHRPKKMIRRRT